MKPKENTLSERQVIAALNDRHPAPAWAFLEQVRNATGAGRVTRTADACAMSLYPSRGLELHGFEVKVHRSDWLRELKDPAKAEEISRFCNRWWIVVGDEAVVKPEELPPTWGLLVPKGKALVVRVPAPVLPAQPPTLAFIAAILRNAQEHYEKPAAVEHLVHERISDLRARWEEEKRLAFRALELELDSLKRSVDAFEKASGVNVSALWSAGNVGAAVKVVMDGGADRAVQRLEAVHAQMQQMTENLGESLSKLKQAPRGDAT